MIVVGGEALVDLVPAEPGGALAPLVPTLGGGPYNAALAASRLGAPCSFLSRISVDAFGDALLLRLRESDVGTDLVQRGPEPTSLAVVALACDGSARYSFYTDGTADRLVRDPGSAGIRLAQRAGFRARAAVVTVSRRGAEPPTVAEMGTF